MPWPDKRAALVDQFSQANTVESHFALTVTVTVLSAYPVFERGHGMVRFRKIRDDPRGDAIIVTVD
jgi:hypothetical protein